MNTCATSPVIISQRTDNNHRDKLKKKAHKAENHSTVPNTILFNFLTVLYIESNKHPPTDLELYHGLIGDESNSSYWLDEMHINRTPPPSSSSSFFLPQNNNNNNYTRTHFIARNRCVNIPLPSIYAAIGCET